MPAKPVSPQSTAKRVDTDARRFARNARRQHGADAWLMELLAPLRNVRLGRVSVGSAADIATFCLRHLREDRAPQIAAALAFRTLFGLLPVLVVVTLIAKAALGDEFLVKTEGVLESVGLGSVQFAVPAADGGPAAKIGLDQWLMQLIGYANTLNITALGWTGFALVALSAIWVLVTIEEAFNVIYRCQQGRSWVRRILVYWFVLTVGPLLLGLAPIALARAAALEHWLRDWAWIAALANILASITFLWLLLLSAYMTIPTVRVAWRPSMIGALVGAVLLQIGKSTFGLYVSKAFGVSALYGSLGLIPLFMFWVYLMWLVILFGAEVAALLQAFRGRDLGARGPAEPDAESSLRALRAIATKFESGSTSTLAEVASAARLPTAVATLLIDRFEDGGFVRRTGEADEVGLARPADGISLIEVMDQAWAAMDRRGEAGALERKLREAQRAAVGGTMLADA
ncbi:MAG: YhjD/YihY/BrkB family envelope integrity protein [Phycisphaerae bacterium]|nr:YhjD/YihY/BrkB family envelope integrity protein [Phycisphaerae bacterium]